MTFSLILDRARRRGRGKYDERIPSHELSNLKKLFCLLRHFQPGRGLRLK